LTTYKEHTLRSLCSVAATQSLESNSHPDVARETAGGGVGKVERAGLKRAAGGRSVAMSTTLLGEEVRRHVGFELHWGNVWLDK
jgi:hypothetical protein